jgi:hypothetical protein
MATFKEKTVQQFGVAKTELYKWQCPNCATVQEIDGLPDVIICQKCNVNQLAYTIQFVKLEG